MNDLAIPRAPRCQHTAAKIKGNNKGSAGPIVWICPGCENSWKSDPLDRYYTGHELATKVVDWALRDAGPSGLLRPKVDRVLEPSAGDGALVQALLLRGMPVMAVEIDQKACKALRALDDPGETGKPSTTDLLVETADFIRWKGASTYKLAVMNPPYSHPDGADGLHVAHALRHAERVVALVRANFLHGFKRWHQVFRWARLTRQVILARRPPFYGPADAGHTARHDYQIIELVRLGIENRLEMGQAVQVEFWL